MITIVSGLARSGTSMMMYMLDSAGIEVVTDNFPAPCEHNPNGFYEHYDSFCIKDNPHWISCAEGKAIKIRANFVIYLSTEHKYKIVFMERDLNEVLISRKKMYSRFQGSIESLEQISRKAKEWISEQENVEVLFVNYNKIMYEPINELIKVADFLDIDVIKMASVVDLSLYRNK